MINLPPNYEYTYGYFYKESEPEKGTYIQLPNGNGHEQRLKAAAGKGVDWDMCLLYCSNDGSTFFTNNYGDEENARAIDRDANHHYNVNRKTFVKEVTSTVFPHLK